MKELIRHPALRVALLILFLELCGALSLVAGIFSYGQARQSYTQSQTNTKQLQQLDKDLNRATVVIQQELAQQAAAAAAQRMNAAETAQLINEINFICSVSAVRAKELGLPPPPTGLCNLVLTPTG